MLNLWSTEISIFSCTMFIYKLIDSLGSQHTDLDSSPGHSLNGSFRNFTSGLYWNPLFWYILCTLVFGLDYFDLNSSIALRIYRFNHQASLFSYWKRKSCLFQWFQIELGNTDHLFLWKIVSFIFPKSVCVCI